MQVNINLTMLLMSYLMSFQNTNKSKYETFNDFLCEHLKAEYAIDITRIRRWILYTRSYYNKRQKTNKNQLELLSNHQTKARDNHGVCDAVIVHTLQSWCTICSCGACYATLSIGWLSWFANHLIRIIRGDNIGGIKQQTLEFLWQIKRIGYVKRGKKIIISLMRIIIFPMGTIAKNGQTSID